MATTLTAIEQETAARCGPFEVHRLLEVGTATTVPVRALRSSIDLGGYSDLWLLRRSALAGEDRQRRVVSLDPATGTLTVDAPYTVPTTVEEVVELLAVEPNLLLRAAVRRGLARCYFVERAAVPVTPGNAAEVLSATLWWLTDQGQIRDVQWRPAGADPLVWPGAPLCWYRPISSSAGVGIEVVPGAASGVYVVEALRPHYTYVNGADAPTGPAFDADTVLCDLEYAVAAGHLEVWRRGRAVLQPIAAAGYADSREAARGVFEQQVRAQWWYWDRPDRVRLPLVGGLAWPPTGGGGAAAPTQSWGAVGDQFTWQGLVPQTWQQVLNGLAA